MSAFMNAAAAEIFLVALCDGNAALIDRLLAPEYVAYLDDTATAFDRAGVQQLVAASADAPAALERIEMLAATGDQVVTRLWAGGTSSAGTSFAGVNVLRFRHGKVVEHRLFHSMALPPALVGVVGGA